MILILKTFFLKDSSSGSFPSSLPSAYQTEFLRRKLPEALPNGSLKEILDILDE